VFTALGVKKESGACSMVVPCFLGKGVSGQQLEETINRILNGKPYEISPTNPGSRLFPDFKEQPPKTTTPK
jgi:hypothetical protein